MKYYLINGEIKKGDDMPNPSGFNIKYSEWHSSLHHCLNIKDDDIKKVIEKVFSINPKLDIPIEVTEFINDNNGVITFREVKECQCLKCSPIVFPNLRFNVCSICGNKRCPHASDHEYKCTNSNDVGQVGSVYSKHDAKVETNDKLELTKKIFGLVNHLYELAEVSVEKRQSINDEADKYVLNFILENMPSAKKSEANESVDFAEWIENNNYWYSKDNKIWKNYNDKNINISMQQLYETFSKK